MNKFEELRLRHPRFFYNSYDFAVLGEDIVFSFEFELEPGIFFRPKVIAKNGRRGLELGNEALGNIAFHLGLMEIPSYWKTACSPEIVIRAGGFSTYQIEWFKKLIFRGMGEFFFVNKLNFSGPDFVRILAEGGPVSALISRRTASDRGRILVPVGGGKDSIVSIEILKKSGRGLGAFLLNPARAALSIVRESGIEEAVIFEREIDGRLIALNKEGYLNGHTPFSSYLAFASVSAAAIFGYGRVAVSNEGSANEGNFIFEGMAVNHQYSKSFEFERDFREYCSRYFNIGADYFSFLRPIFELQIAKIFSGMFRYFSLFRSCNKRQGEGVWCEECSKCLFVFAALFPFVDVSRLTGEIFSGNLFEKRNLLETAFSLLGRGGKKPLECVGSFEETVAAFYFSILKAREGGGRLPFILEEVEKEILASEKNLAERAQAILFSWNDDNFLPGDLRDLLKGEIEKL